MPPKRRKDVPPVTCVAILAVEDKTKRPDKRWRRYERVVRITPGQSQNLELELRVGRRKHVVHIRLLQGRWSKLPTRNARIGIKIPSLGQLFWADLERYGPTLVSGQFRHFTGKAPDGRHLAGRFVGGYNFYFRPETPEEFVCRMGKQATAACMADMDAGKTPHPDELVRKMYARSGKPIF